MKRFLFITLLPTVLWAQTPDTVFVRDVNVVRDYTPTIRDARRIEVAPVVPTVPISKREVQYMDAVSPADGGTLDLRTLPSASVRSTQSQPLLREGYVRVGAGLRTSFIGDVYAPLYRKSDRLLDLDFHHLSTFGKVKLADGYKPHARHADNALRLGYEHNFTRLKLQTSAAYSRCDFNYYGRNVFDAPQISDESSEVSPLLEPSAYRPRHNRDAHNLFDVSAGVVSNSRMGSFDFSARVAYAMTQTYTGIRENLLNLTGGFFRETSSSIWGVDFGLENQFYNTPSSESPFFLPEFSARHFDDPYSVIRINPYYTFRRDIWSLRLGLHADFVAGYPSRHVAISPDVRAQVTLVDKILYLYANLTGDLQNHTLRSLWQQCRYYRPDHHATPTYIPLDASLGLKTKLTHTLIFNASVGYKLVHDARFFSVYPYPAQAVSRTFTTHADDGGLLTVGGSLSYRLRKTFDMMLEGWYYHWNLDHLSHAWHEPSWRIGLDATWHATDDLSLSLRSYVIGQRYVLASDGISSRRLKPYLDLNLEARYEFNSWLAAFLMLNDLTNSNYEIFQGYNCHRFNFLAGLTFSF